MPCDFIAARCSLLPRIASRPPCTFGWSVLTRPSIISGKPVSSETSFTFSPAVAIALAVPPVEINSTPRAASALAKSISPVLSETDNSARATRRVVSVMGKVLFLGDAYAQARGDCPRASRWCSIQSRQSRERGLVSSFWRASQWQQARHRQFAICRDQLRWLTPAGIQYRSKSRCSATFGAHQCSELSPGLLKCCVGQEHAENADCLDEVCERLPRSQKR